MTPISHFEYTTRTIARYELLQFAEALGWPALHFWIYPREYTLATGELAWRSSGAFPDASTRRHVYALLMQQHHQQEETK